VTGCVVWTGATSHARAGEKRHGAFWYEGKRWPAHRWAAQFIHGLGVTPEKEVRHTCRDTLCVQHVACEAPTGNTRQHWLLVSLGYGEDPDPDEPEPDIPFDVHEPPDWLRPYIVKVDGDEPPF
jgi:hypothetical protein